MTPTPPSRRFSPTSFLYRPTGTHRSTSRGAISTLHSGLHPHHTSAGPPQLPVTPLADDTAAEGIDEDITGTGSQRSGDEDLDSYGLNSGDEDEGEHEDDDADEEIDEEGLREDGEEEGGIEEGSFELFIYS